MARPKTIAIYPPVEPGTTIRNAPPASLDEQTLRMHPFRKTVEDRAGRQISWWNRQGRKCFLYVSIRQARLVWHLYNRLPEHHRTTFCAVEPPQMVKIAEKLYRKLGGPDPMDEVEIETPSPSGEGVGGYLDDPDIADDGMDLESEYQADYRD